MPIDTADLESVKSGRQLLADPDPVPPIVSAAADALRARLNAAFDAWQKAWEAGEARLAASDAWNKLDPDQKHELRRNAGLLPLEKPEVDTPASIQQALSQRSFSDWENVTKALPTRIDDALAEALILLEPKARTVTLPTRLIRSEADLDAWIEAARDALETALADGPVTPKV